jgi:hypothetical protein
MDITSPYVVVTAIVVAFLASILFATSSRPDDAHDEHHGHAH